MMAAYIWVKRQKLSNTVSKLRFQNKSEFRTEWNKYSPTREISIKCKFKRTFGSAVKLSKPTACVMQQQV